MSAILKFEEHVGSEDDIWKLDSSLVKIKIID